MFSTPGVGRVYYSTSLQVTVWADASFGNLTEGRSMGGYFLSVGPNNAPFHSVVKFLSVPTNPMDSEYMNTTSACKLAMHYRYFSAFCGWSQSVVPMFLDSQTAINLAVAPQVSKKSLHLDVKYHYIRLCVAEGSIKPIHVPSDEQRANILTKFLSKPKYLVACSNLLNTAAVHAVT